MLTLEKENKKIRENISGMLVESKISWLMHKKGQTFNEIIDKVGFIKRHREINKQTQNIKLI